MTGHPPTPLREQAFLIAYDIERQRMVSGGRAGGSFDHAELVCAAVLAELYQLGRLSTGEKKRVQVDPRRTADPILNAVLDDMAGSKPRTWNAWMGRDPGECFEAIQDQLVAERVITVTEKRYLRIITTQRITVRDTRIVRELIADTRRLILGGAPIDQADPQLAVLAVLVAVVELDTVVNRKERRERKERIETLKAKIDPVAVGLRKAFEDRQASSSG
jgi:hypothetical protein